MNLLSFGLTAAFRGLRTGDTPRFVLGSLLALWTWRRGRKKKKVRATRLKLKAGQSVGLRVTAKRGAPKEFLFK